MEACSDGLSLSAGFAVRVLRVTYLLLFLLYFASWIRHDVGVWRVF